MLRVRFAPFATSVQRDHSANLNKGKTNQCKSMCIFFNRDKALFGINLDSANVHGSENPIASDLTLK